ncbi:hypothetical protein AMJ57_02770 [Parcubacteria bacterium SG8_24]|nr:MAG: hypothetical protein AMJ57_02770 [Parcubacteria bacterium SG8_24]
MIGTVIIFILVLSLVVFVHELGHFVSAKRLGLKVEEFGFGFPPRIAGFERRGTIYSVNWIPIGGFVKIKGETGEQAGDPDSFGSRPVWQRAVIISAGVIMNFVLAWFLLSAGYLVGLPRVIDEGLPSYAVTREEKLQIVSVLDGSPAERAELRVGDVVSAVDGTPVVSSSDFGGYTAEREGQVMILTVRRGQESLEQEVTAEYLEEVGRPAIGVAMLKTGLVSFPLWAAPIEGAGATYAFTREITVAIGTLIRDVFRAEEVSIDFSGPVGIAVITGEVARLGFRHLLQFTALLSINLGIINVLPIPALDGGRLLFLAAERIRGRAVDWRIEATAHNIGFALLMLLVIVVTYRDMVRFGDRIMRAFTGLFGA